MSKKKGFASMTPEQRSAIASLGGRAAHAQGTAHQFTKDEARAAGRKGGLAAHAAGKAHRYTSEEASVAGKKGASAKRVKNANTSAFLEENKKLIAKLKS